MKQMDGKQFIFLLCSERSGSNLITRMMNQHPRVCGPAPKHFVRYPFFNRVRYGNFQEDNNWEQFTDDIAGVLSNSLVDWKTNWSGESLRERIPERTFAALVERVFSDEAEAQEKDFIFVKENEMHHLAPFVVTAFSQARFLYFVRDPRDMVLSHMSTAARGSDIFSGTKIWQNDQQLSLRFHYALTDDPRKKQSFLMRYEDLLENAEAEMKTFCQFLGIEFAPEMITFHENGESQRIAEMAEGWKNLSKPLMVGNSRKYRDRMNPLQVRYIESICRDEMHALGYEPEYERGDPEELRQELLVRGLDHMENVKEAPAAEKQRRSRFRDALSSIFNRPIQRAR